jgi:PAS domain S-box-containing protein
MTDQISPDSAPRSGLQRAPVRYALAVATVLAALTLRKLLEPITGTGAPFVLFFGAVAITSLWGGPGPGALAALLSAPLGAYLFVVRAGYTASQAAGQGALFAIDGVVVVYLSFVMTHARRTAETSDAHRRDLIELAPDAFFLSDLEGRFTEVNPAACRMLGYERAQLVGKTIMEIIPAEDLPRLSAVRTRLLGPEQFERGEWTLKRRDGSSVPVEISANILPGGRWQAFARDISARKRVEDERQVFVSLLENSPDFIGIADPAGKPIYVNPAGRRMVGLAADYPVETTQIPDYYPSEERALAVDVIMKAMIEQGRWSGETSFRHWQTGAAIPVSDEHFVIRDPSGRRVLGMGTVTRDVTERKRFEKDQSFLADAGAVLSSSLDYEQTLSTLGQLVVRDVADWCIIDLVEADEPPRRLKVISADPRQAPLAARLERLPLDRALAHMSRPVLDTRRPVVVERTTPEWISSSSQSAEHLEILRAIGPRSVLGLPLLIRGQLLGALVLISTRPSRRYGPADLRLGEALAERAALAIENGRLYRRALHATRLRDEVLGVVAHDLRNPVSAIVMQARLLQRKAGEDEGPMERPTERILRAATRMNRLIEDLLDVTAIEAGRLGIEQAPVSARMLLLEAVEAQRALASSASLDVRLEAPSDLPDIRGDQHRLLQVLENLIGNAIKFTPVEGRITVGAAARAGEVLFWVADTGGGISPENLPQVFDRFWQASKGAGLGAGLGLPISKGIVEAHGGRLWVESTLGRGSVFFFTIPEAHPAGATGPEALH